MESSTHTAVPKEPTGSTTFELPAPRSVPRYTLLTWLATAYAIGLYTYYLVTTLIRGWWPITLLMIIVPALAIPAEIDDLWQRSGREEIEVDATSLRLTHRLGSFSRSVQIPLHQIRKLGFRTDSTDDSGGKYRFGRFRKGPIFVDYGEPGWGKQASFGGGVSKSEAEQLHKTIQDKISNELDQIRLIRFVIH